MYRLYVPVRPHVLPIRPDADMKAPWDYITAIAGDLSAYNADKSTCMLSGTQPHCLGQVR